MSLTDGQLRDLFHRGDPARRLSPQLPTRVAARLASQRRAEPRALAARAVLVPVLFLSSVGLGAAMTGGLLREVTSSARAAPVALSRPAAKPSVARVDPLLREAALLQQALEALQQSDFDRSIALIDQYGREFPAGALRREVTLARARALLAAHRDSEALETLEPLAPQELPVTVRLTWADALVRNGRCAQVARVLYDLPPASDDDRAAAAALAARCGL